MTYMEQMKEDIREALKHYETKDYYELNDALWIDDSVTGNASGSYFCNRNKAKEMVLADGFNYFGDMVSEFCVSADTIAQWFTEERWEEIDVSIRCYLLGQALQEVLDEED